MTRRVRSIAVALGLALGVAGVAGCGSDPDLSAARAHALQASVLRVTQAAAEGRWQDAARLLAGTRARLDTGVDRGEVSTVRYRAIDAALDGVEAELVAAQQRAAAAQAAAEKEAAEKERAAQEAAQQATPTPEPVVQDPRPGPGKGDDGKGKPGKGKPRK